MLADGTVRTGRATGEVRPQGWKTYWNPAVGSDQGRRRAMMMAWKPLPQGFVFQSGHDRVILALIRGRWALKHKDTRRETDCELAC